MRPGHEDGPGYEHWPHSEDRSGIPSDDELTAELVDHAIEVLATARSPLGATDPAVRLSCLASLQAEAEGRTEEAVALAYEAGYDWAEIAMRIAVFPVEEVAERFGPASARRPRQPQRRAFAQVTSTRQGSSRGCTWARPSIAMTT